jgi:hypothetical protein
MYACFYVCTYVHVFICMYVTLIRFSRYCIAVGDDMAPFALRSNLSIIKRDSNGFSCNFLKLNRNLSVVKKILKVWHCKGRIIQWVSSAMKFLFRWTAESGVLRGHGISHNLPFHMILTTLSKIR